MNVDDGVEVARDRSDLALALRAVRAGSTTDEAIVEVELTVTNEGGTAATDIRVSLFMLTDTHASEMDAVLVDTPPGVTLAPFTLAGDDAVRIDATLAALRADLGAEHRFTPVVVAEACYLRPDGSEGRTIESFVVGVLSVDEVALEPIDLHDTRMREDVGARLHGTTEHFARLDTQLAPPPLQDHPSES